MDLFDELDSGSQTAKNDKPFFKLPLARAMEGDKDALKALHQWLTTEQKSLYKVNEDRFQRIKKNLALNKGIMYEDQELRSGGGENANQVKKRMVQKIVVNVLREANRVRASRILKYKPAVSILPTNDELGDKVAAEATEKLKDHIWYEQRFDGEKLPDLIDAKGPMGEAFLFIEWNPNLGDLHQEYKKAEAAAKKQGSDRVALMGANGEPEKDDKGETIYVDKPVRNGDVEYTVVYTTDLLFHRPPTHQFADSEYVFRRKVMSVEKARLKWPKVADKIKGNKDTKFYDYGANHDFSDQSMVEVWEMHHKRTEELDSGALCIFTTDAILDVKEFPYSHRNLPCVRWTDMKNPGEMHGVSFFEDAKGPAGAYNNLTNMILRNEVMVGHPKWMMPAGAAKIEELGNAITVVQFKGPLAPQLVQANPTGQGAYNLRQTLEDVLFRQADISRTGNGEPPAGVTAAVALQYLAELEAERWNNPVLVHNEAVLQTTIMTIAVAGDYYDPTDKRMIRVLGNDGAWISEFFDAANLAKDYDVRVQNSSALPESKAARIETLMFLAEKFPDRVDSEQVLDMFDFAQSKKFVSEGTLSLKAAEAENEMIMTQKEVGDPEVYEDHVVHWKSHVRKMREWSFKNRAPKPLRESLQDHVMAHEMMMVKQGMKDPAFAQQLSTLSGFPMFFQPTDVAPPATPGEDPDVQAAMAEAAGMGEVMPGAMPPGAGGMAPIQEPPGQPVQPDAGAPVVPPNIEEQMGMEQSPQEPTNAI